MNTYIAIDLETTGINPSKDRIIEIGAVKVADGAIKDQFSTFVNPRMAVPLHIQELTGISTEMAQSGIETHEALARLFEFAGEESLLAHNIMFDYSFLRHKAVNLGIDFERTGIDTLAIARQTLSALKSKRLVALCDYYEIESKPSHRASDDALAAHFLYQKLKSDFEAQAPELFEARQLIHKVKKQGPITQKQKDYLNDLLKYHRIEIDMEVESLTKNEASRMIDKVILENGRMKR